MEKTLFELEDSKQYQLNLGIAVELIKKILYKNDQLSTKELNKVIDIACRSVKGKEKLV